MDKHKKVYAKDLPCIVCKEKAVAFWPVFDPDIESHAYCRKCLDDVKIKTMIKIQELQNKPKKPNSNG